MRLFVHVIIVGLAGTTALMAQTTAVAAKRAAECPPCAEWNLPQAPLRIFGNTYYVGTRNLASILITSPSGHVLIDGALPESAPLILANIRALGFEPRDVKLIVNSHAHYDHAGGIAELRHATGAEVAAMPTSAAAMERGNSGPEDPQFGILLPYPTVASVRRITDGARLQGGSVSLTAHLTAGHTPGGTTWTWKSCERDQCFDFVYADSQTPISADNFLFTKSTTYPAGVSDFQHGAAVLEKLSCDILITPHPGASNFWQRVAGGTPTLVNRDACRALAETARRALDARLRRERGEP
jgi:metallo-beta-lactamase class B